MEDNLNVSVDFIMLLKQQILRSRYIVAKIANAESLQLYYNIGKAIDEQFESQSWGTKILDTISLRLQQDLPGLRGFSASNLKKMRVFYKEWKTSNVISSSTTTKLENTKNGIGSSVTTELQKIDFSPFLNLEPLVRDLRNVKNNLQLFG